MKKAFPTLAAIAIACGPLTAEITTVILPKENSSTFTVAADENSTKTGTLTFGIPPAFPAGTVVGCELRIVPTPQPNPPRANQDVVIRWNDRPRPVGVESTYSDTNEPLSIKLSAESCFPGTKVFTLETTSKHTKWDYYGAAQGQGTYANWPRLIVTYDSPSPAHSGDVTDWTYSTPSSFFSSRFWSGASLITNPVSYDGALYFIAKGSRGGPAQGGPAIERVAGAQNIREWQLDLKEIGPGSPMFVTARGRLLIVGLNAIYSCDLKALESLKTDDAKPVCARTGPNEGIALNKDETPAMGPDGSLYLKNVRSGGSIVGWNPSIQEIWKSDLKLDKVSPIALNASGQYAYVLAQILLKGSKKEIALLSINTATGETVEDEISYRDQQKNVVKPLLQQLLKPAVITKVVNDRSVDYVFVAGNSDLGVLQLVAIEPNAKPRVVWSKVDKWRGRMSGPPVASLDGNSVFVAWQDGTVARYPWYSTVQGKPGAYTETDLKPEELGKVRDVSQLLVDGGGSVYINTNSSLWTYDATAKKLSETPILEGPRTLQFTTEGALIGYSRNVLFDLSPKSGQSITPLVLANNTIYSADTVTVTGNSGVQSDHQVILKGNNINFPANFKWPVGATLQVFGIPKQ